MKRFYALITAIFLYAVFYLSIGSKFAAEFMEYLVEN